MNMIGSCHCGAVKYEIEAEIEKLAECNCSICSRKGHLMAFVNEDNFKILSGEDYLSDYRFHKQKINHRFCKNCGIAMFGEVTGEEGKQNYAINARCLEGFDFKSLTVDLFDGKNL